MGADADRRPGILVLFGTRPEAIKLAPVVRALAQRADEVDVSVVSTGQHDELLESALSSLDMRVDEDLGIMRPNQDLYDIGIECLGRLRALLRSLQPQVVVVEGDTATVFYGSLAAFYEHAQVAHVEAGLRSRSKWAPFPEEIYRRLADVLSDLYFAPTVGARDNLLAEGVPGDRVHVTGNTVVDAVQSLAEARRPLADPALDGILSSGQRIVLITVHRRESFGGPVREIFAALRALAEQHPEDLFVYPLHPNPNVRRPAAEILSDIPNFKLLEPLRYSDMVRVLASSHLVLTDSGGVQEEAPSFGVPVLVLREVTERPEGVAAGVAELVGTSAERIVGVAAELLENSEAHRRMSRARNPYGDGLAGGRIADILLHHTLGTPRRTEDWS